MNKNFKNYLSIWTILLVIFNVVVFVTPNEMAGMNKFGGAFWVGYIFILLAFIGQLAVSYFVFKTECLDKLFYKIPLVRISWTGLVLILIFGAVCMIIPNLPNWVGIILCFVTLGFEVISLTNANVVGNLISKTDEKIKEQTLFIKMLTLDAETLMVSAKSENAKRESKKVYEAVRYSDPMSNAALSGLESEISIKFNQFAQEVSSEGVNIEKIAAELVILLADRNKKCKLLK